MESVPPCPDVGSTYCVSRMYAAPNLLLVALQGFVLPLNCCVRVGVIIIADRDSCLPN